MIECFVHKDGSVRQMEPSGIGQALKDNRAVIWVDLETPAMDEGEFLKQSFGFHPLAIEDCMSPRQRPPKLDDFGSHLFIVVHGLDHNMPPGVLNTLELDMFIGTNYLVTSHRKRSMSVMHAKEECLRNPTIMAGPDILAHQIMDGQIDGMLSPVEGEVENVAEFKRQILLDPRPSQLQALLATEEELLKLHRVLQPEMRALQAIARRGEPFVRESTLAYFKDIEDHVERLREAIDMVVDMVERSLSAYFSITANRTSDFTKALSVVALIFLPLALIAGIYGMNFTNMPELEWKYGYFILLGVMLFIALGMLVLFRRKRWI